MKVMEMAYIPIIALVHLGFIYIWNLKIRKRAFSGKKTWGLAFFGSIFNVWGLDALTRELVVDSIPDMIKVSTACWLVFVLATNAKYLAIYGWSKREFWLDYGGDWVGFIVAGILVFVMT
ncbi:MAG: hypothetical protein K2Q18_10300 [Bdellovibrionales bacterium]|nr:hypothetical protein [Bdellovibrionales bacterium]